MTFFLLEFTNKLDDLGNYSRWMNRRTEQINKIKFKASNYFCGCAKAEVNLGQSLMISAIIIGGCRALL
ncbi:hypothetical protein KFK09_024862 [Dendrobium nobile]|uniref:Uncharacterized protein n=1 Tax=Dendrobium nobile TaxID=94219 RepID=A0A8T3AEY6_DENNO|nr:hypothetical protein KFK09_024862 [Dendrobium nobile]